MSQIFKSGGGGGGSNIQTITGNDGIPNSAIANNFNFLTANSTVEFKDFPLASATETLDFGLTNLLLGSAGSSISGASDNVGLGDNALNALTSGSKNNAFGSNALDSVTTAIQNVAVGFNAANGLTTGSNIVALGHSSMAACGAAVHDCTGIGADALSGCTGNYNLGLGSNAMVNGVSGQGNTAIGGFTPLNLLTTGSFNVGIGYNVGAFLTTGSNNIIVGENAGNNYTGAESGNIILNNAGVLGESNITRIGTEGTQSKAFIAGINGNTVSNAKTVTIDSSTGQLGTQSLSGNMVLISSQTVSSVANFTVTSGISGYDVYFLQIYGYIPSDNNSFLYVQYSTDGGATYISTGYTSQAFYSDSGGDSGNTDSSTGAMIFISTDGTDNTAYPACGYTYLYGLASSAFQKTTITQGTFNTLLGPRIMGMGTTNTTTSVVNALNFLITDAGHGLGPTFSGTFKLYGIVN